MNYLPKRIQQLTVTAISAVCLVGCSDPPTDFYEAAEDGDLEALIQLIDSGVDVNENKGRDGETALHRAATRGKFEAAKLLIENGANVNIGRTYDGDTPLDLASSREHSEIADLLRDHGGKTSNELKVEKE